MQRPASSAAALFVLAVSAALLTGCPSKPKYPECNTDPDCAEQKQVCVEKQCKECRDDKNCKEGFVCKANACVPKAPCHCTNTACCGCGRWRCRRAAASASPKTSCR